MTALFSLQNDLAGIEHFDRDVSQHFDRRLEINASLTRQLVSFQANKSKPVHR
jgi:hypothetical protein